MAGRRYAPIRDYAVIGDGRTVALVARDGRIDWLCLPNLDSPSVFAALLDADRGGYFELRPDVPFDARRRYLPGTNVLQTTFVTAGGTVRVTDAMTLPGVGLSPVRELARRIEGLAGRVPLRWRVEPRFGYASAATRFVSRGAWAVAVNGGDALAICAWDAGRPTLEEGAIAGDFDIADGGRAMLALVSAPGEPLVFPPRRDVEARLDATTAFWGDWSARLRYAGPWHPAVVRSALALKLLVFAPSGAIAAAATTSLPEGIGGERNWDYRYCWIRDASFTMEALWIAACPDEADDFFAFMTTAAASGVGRGEALQIMFGIGGEHDLTERELPHLEG